METGFLIDEPVAEIPETLSKRGFAEHLGVTQPWVSQLIGKGMPVEHNGRIPVVRAKQWISANIDPNRRRSNGAGVTPATPTNWGPFEGEMSPREQRVLAEAQIAKLKAEKLAGRLIDRRATIRAIEARAKAERDALIGWVNRVAPAIAGAIDADLTSITAILDREVRAHLVAMAEKPLEIPK